MAVKIADSELEVMRILWREKRPLSFAEIRKELEQTTDWKKSTIQTLVTRLRGKNAISAENHYVTLYTANISEDKYMLTEGQNFIDRLFGGNAMKLVTALCKSGKLAESDVDELKSFFQVEGGEQ
jgi:BlaI family penicillinase repressor